LEFGRRVERLVARWDGSPLRGLCAGCARSGSEALGENMRRSFPLGATGCMGRSRGCVALKSWRSTDCFMCILVRRTRHDGEGMEARMKFLGWGCSS